MYQFSPMISSLWIFPGLPSAHRAGHTASLESWRGCRPPVCCRWDVIGFRVSHGKSCSTRKNGNDWMIRIYQNLRFLSAKQVELGHSYHENMEVEQPNGKRMRDLSAAKLGKWCRDLRVQAPKMMRRICVDSPLILLAFFEVCDS